MAKIAEPTNKMIVEKESHRINVFQANQLYYCHIQPLNLIVHSLILLD